MSKDKDGDNENQYVTSPDSVSVNDLLLPDQVEKKDNPCKSFLYKCLPITKFMSDYSKEKFSFDLTAGVTVGIMAIPQSLSYALLVKLPPQYGLYCLLTPLIMYGLLGTCGQITIGPCAIVSMMCGSALNFLDPSVDFDDYVRAVMTVSFIGGAFLCLLGIFRLGFITSVMSETVVTSFTAGSAFNIAACQFKHFWGVKTEKESFVTVLLDIFRPEIVKQFNWYAFIIGISACILLYMFKEGNKRYLPKQPLPVELLLIIIYVSLSWGFDLQHRWKLKIVGDQTLVKGFPPFTTPSFKYLDHLLPQGILIAIIAFIISLSAAKTFSRKNGYKIDISQELIALGSGSLVGSFFSTYSPSASLSRSSLINNIGSKTPLNTIISGGIILLCLFFLMDIIKFIPNACLGAIVIINLISLFKRLGDMKTLWKSSKDDFWTFALCVLATLSFGTQGGLIVGLVISFVCVLVSTVQAKKKDNKELEPIRNDHENVIVSGSSLCFLNCQQFQHKVEDVLEKPSICIVDLRRLHYIDATAMIALSEIHSHYNKESERVLFVVDNEYLRNKLDANCMENVKTTLLADLQNIKTEVNTV